MPKRVFAFLKVAPFFVVNGDQLFRCQRAGKGGHLPRVHAKAQAAPGRAPTEDVRWIDPIRRT